MIAFSWSAHCSAQRFPLAQRLREARALRATRSLHSPIFSLRALCYHRAARIAVHFPLGAISARKNCALSDGADSVRALVARGHLLCPVWECEPLACVQCGVCVCVHAHLGVRARACMRVRFEASVGAVCVRVSICACAFASVCCSVCVRVRVRARVYATRFRRAEMTRGRTEMK